MVSLEEFASYTYSNSENTSANQALILISVIVAQKCIETIFALLARFDSFKQNLKCKT